MSASNRKIEIRGIDVGSGILKDSTVELNDTSATNESVDCWATDACGDRIRDGEYSGGDAPPRARFRCLCTRGSHYPSNRKVIPMSYGDTI